MVEPSSPIENSKARIYAIDKLYNITVYDDRIKAFSTAVNFLDRYAAKKGTIPSESDIKIAYKLACAVVYADWDNMRGFEYNALEDMVRALDYELVVASVESILAKEHGMEEVDYEKLRLAMYGCGGSVKNTVDVYINMI